MDSRVAKVAISLNLGAVEMLHHFYENGSASPKYSQAAPHVSRREESVLSGRIYCCFIWGLQGPWLTNATQFKKFPSKNLHQMTLKSSLIIFYVCFILFPPLAKMEPPTSWRQCWWISMLLVICKSWDLSTKHLPWRDFQVWFCNSPHEIWHHI